MHQLPTPHILAVDPTVHLSRWFQVARASALTGLDAASRSVSGEGSVAHLPGESIFARKRLPNFSPFPTLRAWFRRLLRLQRAPPLWRVPNARHTRPDPLAFNAQRLDRPARRPHGRPRGPNVVEHDDDTRLWGPGPLSRPDRAPDIGLALARGHAELAGPVGPPEQAFDWQAALVRGRPGQDQRVVHAPDQPTAGGYGHGHDDAARALIKPLQFVQQPKPEQAPELTPDAPFRVVLQVVHRLADGRLIQTEANESAPRRPRRPARGAPLVIDLVLAHRPGAAPARARRVLRAPTGFVGSPLERVAPSPEQHTLDLTDRLRDTSGLTRPAFIQPVRNGLRVFTLSMVVGDFPAGRPDKRITRRVPLRAHAPPRWRRTRSARSSRRSC